MSTPPSPTVNGLSEAAAEAAQDGISGPLAVPLPAPLSAHDPWTRFETLFLLGDESLIMSWLRYAHDGQAQPLAAVQPVPGPGTQQHGLELSAAVRRFKWPGVRVQGVFDVPRGVAVAPTGEIFVSEWKRHRVQVRYIAMGRHMRAAPHFLSWVFD